MWLDQVIKVQFREIVENRNLQNTFIAEPADITAEVTPTIPAFPDPSMTEMQDHSPILSPPDSGVVSLASSPYLSPIPQPHFAAIHMDPVSVSVPPFIPGWVFTEHGWQMIMVAIDPNQRRFAPSPRRVGGFLTPPPYPYPHNP